MTPYCNRIYQLTGKDKSRHDVMMIIYLDGLLEICVVLSSYPRSMWMTMFTSASIYMYAMLA